MSGNKGSKRARTQDQQDGAIISEKLKSREQLLLTSPELQTRLGRKFVLVAFEGLCAHQCWSLSVPMCVSGASTGPTDRRCYILGCYWLLQPDAFLRLHILGWRCWLLARVTCSPYCELTKAGTASVAQLEACGTLPSECALQQLMSPAPCPCTLRCPKPGGLCGMWPISDTPPGRGKASRQGQQGRQDMRDLRDWGE
jgi:hypothetical protein